MSAVGVPAAQAATRLPNGQWPKGVSGNVTGDGGGRPKGLMAYAREKTSDGRELVDFAYRVLNGEPMPVVIRRVLPTGETVEETYDMTPKLEHRLTALDWLADRGFGKPVQKMEGEIRVPLTIVHRTPPHDPLAARDDEERVLDVAPAPRRALRGPRA